MDNLSKQQTPVETERKIAREEKTEDLNYEDSLEVGRALLENESKDEIYVIIKISVIIGDNNWEAIECYTASFPDQNSMERELLEFMKEAYVPGIKGTVIDDTDEDQIEYFRKYAYDIQASGTTVRMSAEIVSTEILTKEQFLLLSRFIPSM